MSKILSNVRSLLLRVWTKIKRNPKKSFAVALVFGLVFIFVLQKNGDAEVAQDDTRTPQVTVSSVAVLSSESEPLVLLGEVRSVSQAELRAQKSGEVTQVYARAGQYVQAGAVLAEMSNQAERASVLSAQGMLAAAKAQLEKITTGARSEDRLSVSAQTEAAGITLQSTKDSARSAYSQAYSLAQDAVFAQTDDFFSNIYTVNPSFRIRTASFDESNALETERILIGKKLEAWKQKTQTALPDSELDTRLVEAQKDLEQIKEYLNKISSFVSEQKIEGDITSATKSAQEGVVLGARANIDSARSAINGARTGLANAESGSTIATLSESTITTGARSEDVATAQAGVTQAQGALAGAYAQLENTIIRTPISGTVSTLNVARGDFLNAFSVVAVVANEGALEIEVFVSDTARERVMVGAPVLIDGKYTGTVTSVSPGLDPVTKKSRVTVGITDTAELSNGSYVEVALLSETTNTRIATSTDLFVPISAIKVLPKGFAVFSVSEEGTLVAHPIEEGSIVGSKMLVPSGLTPDLMIVTDVRGLSEGDKVETKNQDQ